MKNTVLIYIAFVILAYGFCALWGRLGAFEFAVFPFVCLLSLSPYIAMKHFPKTLGGEVHEEELDRLAG